MRDRTLALLSCLLLGPSGGLLGGCGSSGTSAAADGASPAAGGADAKGAITGSADTGAATAGSADASTGECAVITSGAGRVVIGFWTTADCSGDPVSTNSYPVEAGAPCYCWPGHSGENSADTFSCNGGDGSFTYTQYGSLTCGAGDNTPVTKTSFTTRCEKDIPPTLSSRIIDYTACE